jgi:hypothetical protein
MMEARGVSATVGCLDHRRGPTKWPKGPWCASYFTVADNQTKKSLASTAYMMEFT